MDFDTKTFPLRPAWTEIDLGKLRNNLRLIRRDPAGTSNGPGGSRGLLQGAGWGRRVAPAPAQPAR